MTTTNHTPTPWHFNKHEIGEYCGNISSLLGVNSQGIMEQRTIAVVLKYAGDAESEANAAFIVKAANNHDALVEVLKIWDRREKLGRKNSGKITREEIAELNKLDLEFPKKARAVLAAVGDKS